MPKPLSEFTSVNVLANAVTALVPECASVLLTITPDFCSQAHGLRRGRRVEHIIVYPGELLNQEPATRCERGVATAVQWFFTTGETSVGFAAHVALFDRVLRDFILGTTMVCHGTAPRL